MLIVIKVLCRKVILIIPAWSIEKEFNCVLLLLVVIMFLGYRPVHNCRNTEGNSELSQTSKKIFAKILNGFLIPFWVCDSDKAFTKSLNEYQSLEKFVYRWIIHRGFASILLYLKYVRSVFFGRERNFKKTSFYVN